jgi:hypothetical protein
MLRCILSVGLRLLRSFVVNFVFYVSSVDLTQMHLLHSCDL